MPRQDDLGPQEDLHWQPHQSDFNEILYEQLKKTPWFMISLVIHAVAIFVLMNVNFADIGNKDRNKVEARLDQDQDEEMIEEEEEEIEEEEPEEEPIEEPEVEEETEDDVETTEAEAEDDSTADQPYEGKQSNAAIGLGGGAGVEPGGESGLVA